MGRALVNAKNPVALKQVLASARRGGDSRISDMLRSYEGRRWRIFCEEQLVNATRDKAGIGYLSKQQFSSRLYGLGIRPNARGWTDLGKRCGELAGSMNVALDWCGRRRWLAWKLGRVGGLVYEALGRFKRR